MSRREPAGRVEAPDGRRGRVRAYLRRFITSWVAEDPEPTYSELDRLDGRRHAVKERLSGTGGEPELAPVPQNEVAGSTARAETAACDDQSETAARDDQPQIVARDERPAGDPARQPFAGQDRPFAGGRARR